MPPQQQAPIGQAPMEKPGKNSMENVSVGIPMFMGEEMTGFMDPQAMIDEVTYGEAMPQMGMPP